MKNITPIILAGVTLAVCGCSSADGPVFATDASKPAATTAGPLVSEQSRDITNWQSSGLNMGPVETKGAAPVGAGGGGNPYH